MHLFQQHAVKDFAAAAAKIPVIDYGPYFAGEPGALERLAEQVRYACENIGFLYALNHGVPQEIIDRGFAASRRFHALPLEEKLKLRLNQNNIGYMPMNASVQARVAGAQGDQAEPERELLHQPRSRTGSSGRAGRHSPARPEPVAGGHAGAARGHDRVFPRARRDVRPHAAGVRGGARHAGRISSRRISPTRATPICASCTTRRRRT